MIDFIKRFKKNKFQYDLFVLKEKAIQAMRSCSLYKNIIFGLEPLVQTTEVETKPVEVKEPEALAIPAAVEVPVAIDPVKKKPSRNKTSKKRSK